MPRPPWPASRRLCALRRRILAALLLFGSAIASRAATPPTAEEAEVKAAAFLNIINFATWPKHAFPAEDAPLTVGIVGDAPIAKIIANLIQTETWHGHRFLVRRYSSPREVQGCQVVFLARADRKQWEAMRDRIRDRPVLTVSDTENFARDGGGVQLTVERSRLHIIVNLGATRASHVQLSSNLLHLATIIGPDVDPHDPPQSAVPALPRTWLVVGIATVH